MSEGETSNGDFGISSPGTILKRCRVYHGATIEEVAEATKIAEHHIKALEDDQVREFANFTYLKGFLRIYASHLGLNADDLIRLYEHPNASADSRNNGADNPDETSKKRRRHGIPWQKLALPAVLLLLMILTSLIINHFSAPFPPYPSTRPGTATAPTMPIQPARSSVRQVIVPQAPENDPEQEQAKREEALNEKSAPTNPTPESAKVVVVRLKVVQNGSLAVSIDGAAPQSYDLSNGDVFEWKADKTIALELSNAASVEANLNGRALKSFGASDVPTYVVLDANGVRR